MAVQRVRARQEKIKPAVSSKIRVGSFPCECSTDVPDGYQHEAGCPAYVSEIDALRAENERLRAALTEIMQGARSLDYAIHLARVTLAGPPTASG